MFALVTLPLALFLGVAVYITGMNRIRHAIVDACPASLPYVVLPVHDDTIGVYRSQGTGIRLRPPRPHLIFALVQTRRRVGVSPRSRSFWFYRFF